MKTDIENKMVDRRSLTSSQNLGSWKQQALSKRGVVMVTVRMPVELMERIDEARGDDTRVEWIRNQLAAHFNQ